MLGIIETQLNSAFGCKWFSPVIDFHNVHGSSASGNNDIAPGHTFLAFISKAPDVHRLTPY